VTDLVVKWTTWDVKNIAVLRPKWKKVTITFSCNILMILKIHQTFFKKLI
jgi:hypothetical protein